MVKRRRVTLTGKELAALLARDKADVCKLKHAQVLLRADEGEAADGTDGGPGWCDTRIAEAVGVGVATVQRLRSSSSRRALPRPWAPTAAARGRMSASWTARRRRT